MRYFIYDLETLNNLFLFGGMFADSDEVYQFEMSSRVNERDQLLLFMQAMMNDDVIMVGFNNIGFDYDIFHEFLTNPYGFTFEKARELCMQIISWQNASSKRQNVWWTDRKVRQLDLYKLRHFDNEAKRTSLKALEFAMRMEEIIDLPYMDKWLTPQEMDEVRHYHVHDLKATKRFFWHTKEAIDMRQELLSNGVLKGDVLNWPDVKIGEQYLVSRIGKNKCYNGSRPKVTMRSEIRFRDCVLPKIHFRGEQYNEVLEWFNQLVVYPGQKDIEKPHLVKRLAGLDFHFGLGGVHASVDSKVFHSNEQYVIKDIDVSGMYVAVAIANGFAPEHLGQDFVVAYRQLQSDRKAYKKGSVMNALLKLAGNGVYGKSNSHFSPFYDPKYTYTVTSNGQLQLLQLVEMLDLIPGLQIIQANTDGITAYVPREFEWLFQAVKVDWEKETMLQLEEVDYRSMYIRDVNNYVAVKTDGKTKLKGAYWYPKSWEDYEEASGQWHKDHSMHIVPKVVEKVLVEGWNAEALLMIETDPYNFMKRYKTPNGSKVMIGDQECTKTVRYYISKSGQEMKKISPPKGQAGTYKRKSGISDREYETILASIPPGAHDERIHTKNKSVYGTTERSIDSGYKVRECNVAAKFDWDDLDLNYYLEEINKLIIK